MEGPAGRDGGFPNSDGADLLGFDERDVEDMTEVADQAEGGDPARGPAAGDHDPSDTLRLHLPLCFTGSAAAAIRREVGGPPVRRAGRGSRARARAGALRPARARRTR